MRVTALNVLLLGLMGLAIVGIQLLNPSGAAVEGGVRRYAAAITNGDLDTAMAEIAPERRAAWTDWVRSQLGNVYYVRGIAVRSPSVMQRLLAGAPGGPIEVTAILDVNRDYPDDFYQPTARVDVEAVGGRWYLTAPLLSKP